MKNIYSKNITKAILLLITFFQLAACSKSNDKVVGEQEGNTIVKINIPKIGEPTNTELLASNSASTKTGEIQEEIVPLANGSFLIATLTPKTKSTEDLKKLAATVGVGTINTLKPGVKYRLAVYTSEGDFVTQRDYTAGSESSTEALGLTGGNTYTFISYSVNSTTSLPALINGDKLATANLNNVTEDLMYFKTTFKVVAEQENKLDITLDHKFSLIESTIKVTERTDAVGYTNSSIYNINDLVFSNISTHGGIKFATNEVTYANINAATKKISKFASSTSVVRSAKTEETVIISPNSNTATLTIPAITLTDNINEYTLGNIALKNIKTVPGHRYNLVLKLYKPCTEVVVPINPTTQAPAATFFSVGNATNQTATEKQFTFPAADFGHTFDITLIDNSFQLTINGTNIANNEINFQISDGQTPNITFEDGTYWENGTIPVIWKLSGTETNPMVRVVIDEFGKVSMFASKVNNGPLFPLKLKTGTTFNRVVWNTTAVNTVIARQKHTGVTQMKGYGRGLRRVNCN